MICARAAESGSVECLKYAHENGCEWDEQTCIFAAGNGNLASLKYVPPILLSSPIIDFHRYAHENGCSWGASTCGQAAFTGHLECLR
jgi:hypothetical protein